MDVDTVDTVRRLLQDCRQHDYIVALASDGPLCVCLVTGGYMNYVGRVRSASGSHSCIFKVYLNYVKCLGASVAMETERCQREFLACELFRSVYRNCCPQPYFYDETHNLGFLEDFPAYTDWGETLLCQCDLHSGAQVADMLVSIHSSTHRDKLSSTEFHRLCQTFRPLPKQLNFLCQTQFVKPFAANHGDHKASSLNVRQKIDEVIAAREVIAAIKQARAWMSMESGNSCIHGDLHVHNIMYNSNGGHIVMIDTDCARIGPGAYDVGLLVSNYALLFHYHHQLLVQKEEARVAHGQQLMTDILHLICITLSRYMDGMGLALGESFPRQLVWRQILTFMAVEMIAWISGPPSLDPIDAHPQVQLQCLESGLTILQRMPMDISELSGILSQHM